MTPTRMKLYCSLTSPYSRKVRVAMDELQLGERVDQVLVEPFNSAQPPDFVVANPLGKVPVLVTEKGETLPDSALIIEYLQSRFRGLAPLPKGSLRWQLLRRAQLADGIIGAAVAIVLEKRRPESIVFTSFIDRQASTIRRAVHQLHVEADLLSSDQPGIVEITAGVALAYLDFRLAWIEWRKEHDALAAWYAQFSQRPSMQKTAPPA